MEWDYFTIVARKKEKGAEKLDIISVTKNGGAYKKKSGNETPDFEDPDAPQELQDCVYAGGAVDNRCRKITGTWW